MSYFVIVRGPLGVGKSTVASALARRLRAEVVSIDRILDDYGLWRSGRLAEFLEANRIAARRAEALLARQTPVIFDGNFYWKGQLRDLVRRLAIDHWIFTLDAPLRVCIARDSARRPRHGAAAARAVYAKTTAIEAGIRINAARSVNEVVEDLVARLPPRVVGRAH